MRLVIARCSVDYAGRLTAHLPSAPRLILVKADGSVSIHADDRAYKPLNWMSPPCSLKEGDGNVWTVENKGGEKLIITLEEIMHDSSHELGVDPGLIKDGVEAHLQELLADRIETLGRWISCAGTPTGRPSPSRSSGAVRSTASSSSPAISNSSTATRTWPR
jgi:endonuclease